MENTSLVGRKQELSILEDALMSRESEMIAVIGRLTTFGVKK